MAKPESAKSGRVNNPVESGIKDIEDKGKEATKPTKIKRNRCTELERLMADHICKKCLKEGHFESHCGTRRMKVKEISIQADTHDRGSVGISLRQPGKHG
jgi:hypothetical protein